jgi:protocatechuate 3,4-dioxygenase beta subunit
MQKANHMTPYLQQTTPSGLPNRRTAAVALVLAPAIWTGVRAQPATLLRPTPRQTEGPFYPVALPRDADFDLLTNGAMSYTRGQPCWLEGTVTDLAGKPLAGAQVEIWQCDHEGHYDHPGDGSRIDKAFQGFGRVTVNAQGQYRFRTIKPVAYAGRTPHIHVKVKLGRNELLTTQMYVEGEAANTRDFLWRSLEGQARSALTVPFKAGADGLQASFPLVVQA